MKVRVLYAVSFLIAVCFAFSVPLSGQATRTWVSGVGDDANPCSRTAPCKTFAGAISKTAAGGEISTLDPGGFGAVTITKSITIDGAGTLASILSASTNGIVVKAGPSDSVIIRGITINGAGSGVNGIRFLTGGRLHLENVKMSGFTTCGISFEPSAVSQLSVLNTTVQKAAYAGIIVRPTGAGSARAVIENSSSAGNAVGVRIENNSIAFLKNVTVFDNACNGFLAYSLGGAAEMNLENCMTLGNALNGVLATGPYATIRLSNVTVTGNSTALAVVDGGTIFSFGNNKIASNTVDNIVPTPVAMK